MLSVLIRMALYCIVFQCFGRKWWPSSGNIMLHDAYIYGNIAIRPIDNADMVQRVE